jgi:hypothetical protein
METVRVPLPLVLDNVWYNKSPWTYLQVLFESLFSLTNLLNVAMMQKF